jgi:hypothetical protein
MDSIRKGSGSKALSEKKSYEPPRAMRLGEMRGGAGACDPLGSGDSGCYGGNNAVFTCDTGNSGPND